MKSLFVLLGATFMVATASAVDLEEMKLKTPRGAEVSVKVSVPPLSTTMPTLVLASGRGYHMDLPLQERIAVQAAKSGYIVYRFNWAYYEAKGQPSADLSFEMEDIATVLAAVGRDVRVDQKRIVVGGKSMGSMISYDLFSKTPALKALLLLTPVCTAADGSSRAEAAYPGLTKETRSVAVVLGNKDPGCTTPVLFDFLKTAGSNIAVNVVGGAHGFEMGTMGDPATAVQDEANLTAAVSASVFWLDYFARN